jgi:hypothetical protein
MDELVGLIAGYMMVFELVEDQEVRDAVREQVNDLGDYLAEHGYTLVRPLGEFTSRGASGSLPALEFPFGRVFARITGNAYGSRTTFQGACEKAGTWARIKDGLWRWEVLGQLSTGLWITLLGLILGVSRFPGAWF